MSALVLALAGLAAGSGPGDEATTAPVGVRLVGAWTGTWRNGAGRSHRLKWDKGWLWKRQEGPTFISVITAPCTLAMEGKGRARLLWGSRVLHALWRLEGDRLILCLDPKTGNRPSAFRLRTGTEIWTLRPATHE